MGVDLKRPAHEATDVCDQKKNGRDAQRMRTDRFDNGTTGKVGNGMAKTAPRAKCHPGRIKWAEAKQMLALRIHRDHCKESDGPHCCLHRPPAPESPPDVSHPPQHVGPDGG